MNEKSWERTDTGGSSTGSFDLRGRVSPFFFWIDFSCEHREPYYERGVTHSFFLLKTKNTYSK